METKTINKAYKTQLKPNKAQIDKLTTFGHVSRRIYNWALDEKLKALEQSNKLSKFDQQVAYTKIKNELHPFCNDFPRVAMEYSLEAVHKAFDNYFRKKKAGKSHKEAGFPKFKSVHKNPLSFRVRCSINQIENDKIYLTNIGWVKLFEKGYIHNNINKVNFVTVSEYAGKWFVSVTVEEEITVISATNEPLGLDLGIKNSVILSDGTVYDNSKVYKSNEKKLRKLNKSLSRKQLRSKNWYKAKSKLNKLYAKINRVRNHINHQITSDITSIKQPSIIAMEDLNVSGMVKNKHLSKSILDVGMSEIKRQLEYKSEWNGNKFVQIDRFFPSSKKCSNCGNIKQDLKLSDRTYTCECCGNIIDRDFNASINIKNEALRTLTI